MSLNEARQPHRKNTSPAKKPFFRHDFPGWRSHVLRVAFTEPFPQSGGGRTPGLQTRPAAVQSPSGSWARRPHQPQKPPGLPCQVFLERQECARVSSFLSWVTPDTLEFQSQREHEAPPNPAHGPCKARDAVSQDQN